MTADKGALKGAYAHFINIISWYSIRSNRIQQNCLDTNNSDGSSANCATANKYDLVKKLEKIT